MNIIPSMAKEENNLVSSIENFFKKFGVGSILKASNAYKEKGIPCREVFALVFQLVFTGKTLFMNYELSSDSISFKKDVVYRFLNSTRIHWQRFLLLLSGKVINSHLKDLTGPDRINAFVVDDSFYGRTRSKAVELLSYVRDHADGNRSKKGFRMLTLGWTDGFSFVPVSFNLLSSTSKANINPANPVDKRTAGYKRRKAAILTSPESMIEMLATAISAGISAKYVLFDSWFSFPGTILKIRNLKLHVIAMLKDTPKVYYTVDGTRKTLKEIYQSIKKRRGRAKYLASVLVTLNDKEGNSAEARIVFVRDRNVKGKWLALISTDTELPETEVIRIYGKRWDIEVFFKMCKSYLKLSKEFQGRSYDMMVAHTTIVFSRYIMLSVENRNNQDMRTMGALFFYCCNEVADIEFSEALQLLIDALLTALQEKLSLAKESIAAFLEDFFAGLPDYFKGRLRFSSCES